MQKSGGAAIPMKDNNVLKLAGGWSDMEVFGVIPFHEDVLNFLNELAAEIREDAETRTSEEMAAFAFWCRRRHLEQWKYSMNQDEKRVGWGMLFHIAPSNIPTLFAYSMAMGMLSGNGNIVRISQRVIEESRPLCRVIDQVMRRKQYKNIYKKNLIITYDREEEVTQYYTNICDGRVIWGGDRAIQKIRRIPVFPGIPELVFPDRISVAVFDESWMEHMEEEELYQLACRFYNDTFSMDQNACSSPNLIFWFNGEKCYSDAKNRWWKMLYKVAKRYDLTDWKVSRKYEAVCSMIMEQNEIPSVKFYKSRIYVVDLKEFPQKPEQYWGRFGYFFQYSLESMEQLVKCLGRKVQTVVYAGINPKKIQQLIIESGAKGGDRIVPVGQALTLNHYWDGKHIINYLSRVVDATIE